MGRNDRHCPLFFSVIPPLPGLEPLPSSVATAHGGFCTWEALGQARSATAHVRIGLSLRLHSPFPYIVVFVNFLRYINKTSCFCWSYFREIFKTACLMLTWNNSGLNSWSYPTPIPQTHSFLQSVLITVVDGCFYLFVYLWSAKYKIHFKKAFYTDRIHSGFLSKLVYYFIK